MMLAAVDSWRKWALFGVPDGCPWSEGPVALLGDAVHAMLPFAAQGAGMAIEDAAVLAEHLSVETAGAKQRPAALKQYGRRTSGPCGVQRDARQQGRIYHLTGPVAFARDLAIRAMGRTACWRGRTGSTTGGRDAPQPRSTNACRLAERRRRGAGADGAGAAGGGFPALVAAPGFLGELLPPADRDIIVAIGQLGHHGPADPGLRLRHQALQFGRAGRERLALRFELLAVVQIVFGGIGERRGQASPISASRRVPDSESSATAGQRAQSRRGKRTDIWLGKRIRLRLPKAAADVRIEALPGGAGRLRKGRVFGKAIPIPVTLKTR